MHERNIYIDSGIDSRKYSKYFFGCTGGGIEILISLLLEIGISNININIFILAKEIRQKKKFAWGVSGGGWQFFYFLYF